MQNQKSLLFGRNVFADAFQEFDEQSFFQSLHHKVRNKSYYHKYKGFKNTLLAASYLFNVASMLSACYAVYWLTAWITGMVWAAYLVAAVFLFFLESLKRKSSTEFFQVYFFRKQIAYGWLGLSLFCLGISLASSTFGTKTGTETLAPDPNLIAADSTATAYRGEVAKLEAENALMKNQKDHTGTIYYRLQAVIKQNTAMIADYNGRILELDKKLEGKNDQLTDDYQNQVQTTVWALVLITIFMELLFEACIAYVWYFYYRSYVERKITDDIRNSPPTPPTPFPSASAPPPPENGSNPLHGSENGKNGQYNFEVSTTRKPMGFYSQKQLAQMGITPTPSANTSGQVWTDVDRAKTPEYDDRYTIEHSYTKGGKTIFVHYTMRMVNSRIGQYHREIEDCKKRNLGTDVLQNRQSWLAYWQGKRKDLLKKMNDTGRDTELNYIK